MIVQQTQYPNPQTGDLLDGIRFEDMPSGFFVHKVGRDKGEFHARAHFKEKLDPHRQIFLAYVDDIVSHFIIGMDEEVSTEKGVPAFGLCLGRFSEKKISGVEK